MAHNFIELCKSFHQGKAVFHEGDLYRKETHNTGVLVLEEPFLIPEFKSWFDNLKNQRSSPGSDEARLQALHTP